MSLLRKVAGKVVPRRLRILTAAGIQRVGLRCEHAASSQKLILFMVPGQEFLSGGILSVFSLYRLSRKLQPIHGTRVLMCFFPGEAGAAFRYRRFKNDVLIYPFEMVLQTCTKATDVLVHIPEYAVSQVVSRLGKQGLADLRRRYGLKVNILNQNIMMMPKLHVVQSLKEVIPDLTCTTAHPRYSSREQRDYWGVPMHHLPAWTYPDDAPSQPFETKRNLMIVSPDKNPHREEVLNTISAALPDLEIRVIRSIPFEKYLELERSAKWGLTFGEGMDAYFQGVFFRGGVGFAVYNEDFFTSEYQGLPTIYSSFDAMRTRIVEDIRSFDNKAAMEPYSRQVRGLLARNWGPDKTRKALESFYRNDFTCP